jgi:hypothetical protein
MYRFLQYSSISGMLVARKGKATPLDTRFEDALLSAACPLTTGYTVRKVFLEQR